MSQLVKTRFIPSFQSYQLSSVKWLCSGSLLTAIYSLVRIRATVGLAGGLLAGGLLAGGLLAGGLFPAGGFPCPRRGGIFKVLEYASRREVRAGVAVHAGGGEPPEL